MDLRIRRFEELPHATWDAWVRVLPEATCLHSSMYVRYSHQMVGEARSHSFALLDNRGEVAALCPLGISEVEVAGHRFLEASFNGAPLGAPAIRGQLPSQRRRLSADVFSALHQEMRRLGVSRSLLLKHPITLGVLGAEGRPAGQMEPLSAGYTCQPQNTIVMDLSLTPEELSSGLTHEQRKHLNQSQRRGLRVEEFSGEQAMLPHLHAQYVQAHRQAAGRLTRPEASFEEMLHLAREGLLRLFVAWLRDRPAGFLYCGEFQGFAFGWSQANVAVQANEQATRHLLEWSAVLSYQQRGFHYYELGRRFYGPQLYKVPTPKELSISFFKERYGGQLWPYLVFERFFDRQLCRAVYQKRIQDYLQSYPFDAPAPENGPRAPLPAEVLEG